MIREKEKKVREYLYSVEKRRVQTLFELTFNSLLTHFFQFFGVYTVYACVVEYV